jgi:thioredoxin-like negative regulator of GroEL
MFRQMLAQSLMVLLVSAIPASAHADVRFFTGHMDIVVTSGRSCEGLSGLHDVSLALATDGRDGSTLHGYFRGSGITIGRFSGNDPARLDVRYPFHDEPRASGHYLKLSLSGDRLAAELRDRHIDAAADECNFDLARLELTRSADADASVRLSRMAGQFDAQQNRSQALDLVQSSGYQAALPFFEKALTLADTFLEKDSDEINSYVIGLATCYVWLNRIEDFNRLYDARIMAIKDEPLRTVFSGYRVNSLLMSGRAALGREEFDSALKDFQQAARLQPRSRDAVAAALSVYLRSGRFSEALSFLEGIATALESVDERRGIHSAMSVVLLKKAQKNDREDKLPEAEADLKQALVLDPASVHALVALARLRHKSGSLDEAEALLDQGLAQFTDEKARDEISAARNRIRVTEMFLKKIRRTGS